MHSESLSQKAARLRAEIVAMSCRARSPHLGSALSCVDILVTAYEQAMRFDREAPTNFAEDPDRDRFILSKGHAAMALYAVLAERGILPREAIESFNTDGALLAEHPPPGVPGVEAATGSLGHGLPIGLGLALAAKVQGRPYRVFVLMSDGECNEGSVWEAAMFAPAKGLDNVCAIVDANGWQATDRSADVLALEPLADKWRAFGWHAVEVDGHDIDELREALQLIDQPGDRPLAIIARTVKGKGVSFMEDDNNWHYRVPTEAEVSLAREELLAVS